MRRTLADLGRALALVAALAVLAPGAVRAETEDGSGWQVDFVPYLWLSTVKGTSGVHGETVRVDVDYNDVFDLIGDHFSLLAGMGHLEARHDRLIGFLDLMGTRLDTDGAAKLKGIENERVSTGKINVDIKLRQDTVTLEFGGGYRLLRLPMPNRTAPFTLDAIAGGRYYYYWTSVHATGSTTIKGLPEGSQRVEQAVAGHGDVDWVDPFIGGRFGVPLTDDIEFSFRGDIGGFGAGSDLAWSIVSGLKYRIPWEPVGVHPWFALGYKVLSYDYDKGGTLIDLTYQGPVTGIGLTF